MGGVTVVTDSTASFADEVVRREALRVVPLYIVFGGERTVHETEITDYPAFFDELRAAETLPTTSQPSVGDFVAAYEPLLANGGEVFSIHISGGLSGTCDSARQAAQALERDGKGGERIRVYDSTTAAGGLGLLVLTAARAAARGADGEEVERRVVEARGELKMWFAIDTLEFLKRSGRIGGASAWLGSTLKIKPILTLEREMVPIERVRTSRRAFERLVDYAAERKDSGADGWVVQHIQADEQAQKLVEACREFMGNEPAFVSEVGPVLAAHTGPGMLGVGGIPRSMLPN